jgi:hypothetical protein
MFVVLLAAALSVPELDLQAGYLSDGVTSAPALALRVGSDFADRFTLSLHLTGALGSPLDHASGHDPELNPQGFNAWRLLVEGRVHTRGALQLHLSGAAGIAQLVNWQCNCNEQEWLHGDVAFAARGAAGVRWLFDEGWSISAEFEAARWAGLTLDPSIPASVQGQPAPHLTYGVLAGFGYRWGH